MKKHIVVGALVLAFVPPALPFGRSVMPWSSAPVFAQAALEFESATIKRAAPDAPRNRVMPTSRDRLSIPSMNLTWLIYTAYQEGMGTAWNVTGVPGSIDTTYYAIEGKAAQPSTQLELRLMLRALLAERFGLKVRLEDKDVEDGHQLVLDRSDGKLGPNVKEWDGTCRSGAPMTDDDPHVPRCSSGYFGPGLVVEGGTMYSAADLLSLPPSWGSLGKVVIEDHTGLSGRYTMRLEFPFPAWTQVVRSEHPETTAQPLLEAVREQWGLRIVKGRGVLHVINVESVGPPIE
jgi:uncharacterized protein (TIGR03435 family)